ncbi:MAG: hypothetical protein ACWA5U_07095 [bacterium]
MKMKTALPVVSTGLLSLAAVSQANAGEVVEYAYDCSATALHAEKLTRQAERYQARAAELKAGEHEKYIVALKRRANNMRAKAMHLQHVCGVHTSPTYEHRHVYY